MLTVLNPLDGILCNCYKDTSKNFVMTWVNVHDVCVCVVPPGFWDSAECHWGGEERDTYLHPEDLSPTLGTEAAVGGT